VQDSSLVKPADLRGILQYVPEFRDRVFVIAIDGAVVTDENFSNLLLDIAVLRSLNIRVVLVHGAGAQVRALAQERHITPSSVDGTGVTDQPTMEITLTAANRLTHEILEGLSMVDLRGAAVNAVVAHPLGIFHGIDHQYTGKIQRIDADFLQTLLQNNVVPILPPFGIDGAGRSYRLNSDDIAVETAEALKAVKLLFVTTKDGLFFHGQLLRQIMVNDLTRLLQEAPHGFHQDQLPKVKAAITACNAGVPRVHIINGCTNEALLAEVFSNEGIGTLVYANEYVQIRRAMKKDVRHILALIRQPVEAEELMPRTRAEIERTIDDYYIYEIDRNPVGCVALHIYSEEKKAELACLYVKPSHQNQGIGRKLAQFAETKAREAGAQVLFALSTQAYNFFQSKLGFIEGTPNDLPPARREKYESSGRKSKVLIKHLTK
jgi:amino-acid N-acetyltransferase